jgi:hypothetical protein
LFTAPGAELDAFPPFRFALKEALLNVEPGAPATPSFAVILTRWSAAPVVLAKNAPMLESPATELLPGCASNSKSTIVIPFVSPLTLSAGPVEVGATTVFCPMYVHCPVAGHVTPP